MMNILPGGGKSHLMTFALMAISAKDSLFMKVALGKTKFVYFVWLMSYNRYKSSWRQLVPYAVCNTFSDCKVM